MIIGNTTIVAVAIINSVLTPPSETNVPKIVVTAQIETLETMAITEFIK